MTSPTPLPLTHFDAQGQAHMVDVGAKAATHRVAVARGAIRMQRATFELIAAGSARKGDVIGVARIAAIQAAKRTPELIPLCHPVALTRVAAEFELDALLPGVHCTVTAETVGATGVEMEALTAVQIGLLDDLRHVQGGRPRHGHRAGAAAGKERRPVGPLARSGRRVGYLKSRQS